MSDYIEIDNLEANEEVLGTDTFVVSQGGKGKKTTLNQIKDFGYPPEANNVTTGLVNTNVQSFAGKKSFSDGIATSEILVSGNAEVINDLSVQGQTTVQDLHVLGNVIQEGETISTEVEVLKVKDQLIETRNGATVGMADGDQTGIKANMYDGEHNGYLTFGADGIARVGDEGNTQPLATREEQPINNGLVFWNNEEQQLKTLKGEVGQILTQGEEGLEFKDTSSAFALPIGYVYTQYPFTPEPKDMFPGTWENISWKYNGLFLRVEGEDAVSFENKKDVISQAGTVLTFEDEHGITTENLLLDVNNGERRKVVAVEGNNVTVESEFSSILTTVLIGQSEGLPNITGELKNISIDSFDKSYASGVFDITEVSNATEGSSSKEKHVDITFDASRSNSIYGGSSHVTPNNLSIRIWQRIS